VSKGYDLSAMPMRSNFPKTMFYGSYKARLSFVDKNNRRRGCVIFIVDIIRPWETV